MQIEATVQHEKYIINTYVFGIVIYKFNFWRRFGLIILFEVIKN